MEEITVQLGNTTAVKTTLDDGTQLFRTIASDVEQIEILLLDNNGRRKIVRGHMSTMLILSPVGELGSLAFDRHFDPLARDEEGRICFIQRPMMSREEVFDMIKAGIETMGSRVAIHPAMALDLRRRSARILP